MIYGYARVSTVGQEKNGNSLEDQVTKLTEHGAKEVFCDAYTGTKMDRPKFSEMLEKLKPGDTVVVTKLDRLSRSASQGIQIADELIAKGVSLHILNMGLMDNTPTGKLIRNVLFSFAEFERDMILERTQAGKEVARQDPLWREGRKRIDIESFDEYRRRQEAGEITVTQCCRELGISRGTWYQRIKEAS